MKEVVRYSNAKVTIHIPKLSQEERKIRLGILKGATQGLLMELMKEGNINNDKDKQKMES